MDIIINGQRKTLKGTMDLEALLRAEGLADMVVAVARNGTFVPRSDHAKTYLENGDDIEIVAPMQGG